MFTMQMISINGKSYQQLAQEAEMKQKREAASSALLSRAHECALSDFTQFSWRIELTAHAIEITSDTALTLDCAFMGLVEDYIRAISSIEPLAELVKAGYTAALSMSNDYRLHSSVHLPEEAQVQTRALRPYEQVRSDIAKQAGLDAGLRPHEALRADILSALG